MPYALVLAERLEQQFPEGTNQGYLSCDAATELRRLHYDFSDCESLFDVLMQERNVLLYALESVLKVSKSHLIQCEEYAVLLNAELAISKARAG